MLLDFILLSFDVHPEEGKVDIDAISALVDIVSEFHHLNIGPQGYVAIVAGFVEVWILEAVSLELSFSSESGQFVLISFLDVFDEVLQSGLASKGILVFHGDVLGIVEGIAWLLESLFELEVIVGQVGDEAVMEVHQVKEAVVPDYWLLQRPYLLEEHAETANFTLFLCRLLPSLWSAKLGNHYVVVIVFFLSRKHLNAHIQVFLFDVFVEDIGDCFEEWLRRSVFLGSLFWTYSHSINLFKKEKNSIFMLDIYIIDKCLQSPAFVIPLQFLHLCQLDIVDALTNPFVPIHAVISIELHAAELHGECFIIEDGIPWKKVKIKWVYLESAIEHHQRQTQLKDLVCLCHVF